MDQWTRITPDDGRHYFFGYYDRIPWNAGNRLHLALRAPQREKLPEPGERAEVGVVEMSARRFTGLAVTRAWCHQQGAMTLWLGHRRNAFVYNDWDEGAKRLVARVYSLDRGPDGCYDRPLYALSPDGRLGATLDFARIPRRGYSYADAPLENAPPDAGRDGIFTVDMRSGKTRLAVSYQRMFDLHPAPYLMEGRHVWLNHIIFNCDSSRMLFLLRHHDADAPGPTRQTYMYTCAVDGSDLACPLPHFYWKGSISHQIWGRTPREILVDADWGGGGSDYVVFDERTLPLRATRVSRGLGPPGHLVFSPDGRRLLADTYPHDGFQRLGLVEAADGRVTEIGRFRHQVPPGFPHDARCDLHPRWSADGTLVSVDSIDRGPSAIYCRETG